MARRDVGLDGEVELALDDEGYAEIVGLLNTTLDRALEIQAESLGRLAGADAPQRTLLGLLHFHR